MLDRLLESKSKRTRSSAGAILSVAAHTAVIAAAVYATAQAHIAPSNNGETVRPLYFPRATHTAARPNSAVTVPRPSRSSPIHHIVLPSVPAVIAQAPTLDLTSVLSQPRDFPSAGQGDGDVKNRELNATDSAGTVLRADQVEKQAMLAPGNAPPRYPETLRNAGIDGRVTAMFVVNELGRAEDSTVRLTTADNRLFEDAVRTALHRMRFVAAEVGGRKVRQLVQMPFVFTISK